MISKNEIKLIRSLGQKKFRVEHGLFVAEGHKLINDLEASFECVARYNMPEDISEQQLQQISNLRHPQDAVALFRIKHFDLNQIPHDDIILALDDIQDPGNLGTIIRTADWFGIRHIVCSDHTADIYNPKVVQATMGALAHVSVYYTDLSQWLGSLPESMPIYGTALDGQNIYSAQLSNQGVIIMGNEGNGLSAAVRKYLTDTLLIPNYPIGATTSESLNVAIATALVCSEFRREKAQNPIAAD